MGHPNLTLVVVAKDQRDMLAFDLSNVHGCDVAMLANESKTPLSEIGNRYAGKARTPVLGLVHADCWFGADSLEAFTAAALEGSVCGIVGISHPGLVYHWCGVNPGLVSTLDSCSIFFRPDSGLRFDADLCSGLHIHAEDLCLQAKAKGIPVIVPAADATHRSATTNGQAWLDDYRVYRDRLVSKWAGVPFATT